MEDNPNLEKFENTLTEENYVEYYSYLYKSLSLEDSKRLMFGKKQSQKN